MTGASDPYALVSVGPSTGKTRVVKGTVNPDWNQTLLLYVRSKDADILKVGVCPCECVRGRAHAYVCVGC